MSYTNQCVHGYIYYSHQCLYASKNITDTVQLNSLFMLEIFKVIVCGDWHDFLTDLKASHGLKVSINY